MRALNQHVQPGPPGQPGTLFLKTNQLNLTAVPVGQACLTQKRKPCTENPGASPSEVTLLLKTMLERSGFHSCNFRTLSPFRLSLMGFIRRCIPASNCVLPARLPDILRFRRRFRLHTAAQLLPQLGKSLFAAAAASRGLGG